MPADKQDDGDRGYLLATFLLCAAVASLAMNKNIPAIRSLGCMGDS